MRRPARERLVDTAGRYLEGCWADLQQEEYTHEVESSIEYCNLKRKLNKTKWVHMRKNILFGSNFE